MLESEVNLPSWRQAVMSFRVYYLRKPTSEALIHKKEWLSFYREFSTLSNLHFLVEVSVLNWEKLSANDVTTMHRLFSNTLEAISNAWSGDIKVLLFFLSLLEILCLHGNCQPQNLQKKKNRGKTCWMSRTIPECFESIWLTVVSMLFFLFFFYSEKYIFVVECFRIEGFVLVISGLL